MMMGMYDGIGQTSHVLAMAPDLWALIAVLACVGLAVLLAFHFMHRFRRDIREKQLPPSQAMRSCNRRTLVGTVLLTGAAVLIWIFRIQVFVYWLKVGGP